ncbi:MAG: 50S ribosomal protein L32 [Candidatus Margulisiibacteriota bacterium]
MPVPKKRRSKSKKRMRRAAWKITAPQLHACSNCGYLIPSHVACTECGYYKGEIVVKKKSSGKASKDE